MSKKNVALGDAVVVPNTGRKFGSATQYVFIPVTDKTPSGRGRPSRRFIALTQSEFDAAVARANVNQEDRPAHSWFKQLGRTLSELL